MKKIVAFAVTLVLTASSVAQSRSSKASGKPAHTEALHKSETTAADPIDQHFHAAETFQITGEMQKAAAEYRQALVFALDRMGNVRILTSDLRSAEDLFTRALQIDPTSSPTRLDLAFTEFRGGSLDRAGEDVDRVIAADPHNVKARALRGKILFAKSDFARAADDLQNAFNSDPDFDTAYALVLADLKQKKRTEGDVVIDEMLAGKKVGPEVYSLLGVAYDETGYYDAAVAMFEKALALDPRHPHVHAGIGDAYFEQGESKYPQAQQEFQKELLIDPADSDANLHLGAIALQQQHPADAEKFLQKATSKSPVDPDAWFYLGKSEFELGRWNDSAEALVKSLTGEADTARKSKNDEAQALLAQLKVKGAAIPAIQAQPGAGRVNSTSGLQSMALASSTFHPPIARTAEEKTYEATIAKVIAESYNNLGVIDARAGDLAQAEREFAQAQHWNPELENVDRNWALAAFRSKQYADAIEPLHRLLSKKEDLTQREMLGLSYFMTDQYSSAADTFHPILDYLPNDPAMLYAAGVSLVRSRHPAEAEAIFGRMIKQDDKSPEIHILLGQAYASQEDYDQARDEFNRALALDQSTPEAHYFLGMADFFQGKTEDAAKEFQTELTANPKNMKAAYQLAYLRLQEHRTDEGLSLLNTVLAAEPENADALYQRGKATLEKGDAPSALKDLEHAVQLNPSGDYIYYQLSLADRAVGRNAEAATALKTFEELKAKKGPPPKE